MSRSQSQQVTTEVKSYTRNENTVDVECREGCTKFGRRCNLFECETEECVIRNIYHHAKCYNIHNTQAQIDGLLIKCTGFLTATIIGTAALADYTSDNSEDLPIIRNSEPALFDDLTLQQIENNNIENKPVTMSILNVLHSHLPSELKWSINGKTDYNYREIFRNGIPSKQLICGSLHKVNKHLNGLAYVTVDSQYKDKRIGEMNLYPRPDVVCQYNPFTETYDFTNVSFIKTPGAQRNESKRYNITLNQPHRNCPQLYGSLRFDYYTLEYGNISSNNNYGCNVNNRNNLNNMNNRNNIHNNNISNRNNINSINNRNNINNINNIDNKQESESNIYPKLFHMKFKQN
eukprot:114362_1